MAEDTHLEHIKMSVECDLEIIMVILLHCQWCCDEDLELFVCLVYARCSEFLDDVVRTRSLIEGPVCCWKSDGKCFEFV